MHRLGNKRRMTKIETLLNLLEDEFEEQGSNSTQAKFLKNLSGCWLKHKMKKGVKIIKM